MADDKRKRKADGKRVALKQDHEREYLIERLGLIQGLLHRAELQVSSCGDHLFQLRERLRAGSPARKPPQRRIK